MGLLLIDRGVAMDVGKGCEDPPAIIACLSLKGRMEITPEVDRRCPKIMVGHKSSLFFDYNQCDFGFV